MLKWFSGEEAESGSGPGSPLAATTGEMAVEEMAERLTQTEQLIAQLKEMIREKDAALCSKDDQLKAEKEASEAKLSKLRLQNKAKVTSLTTQLEELRRRHGGPDTPTHSKKGASDGADQASRGKIVLLKKKVEELEQQLAQRVEELENKRKEAESQRLRGEEMDAMLIERDRKLAEKEAYIVHLQTALSGDQSVAAAPAQTSEPSGAAQELQLLVHSLTRKVGEAEERYSLLQEQSDSLKELLLTEKEQYARKEIMYKDNIQTFKDIIIQKDNQLMEISQMHEQELFKLAAKSDASADLEQLLKALKQKLHEKEEVLLGKTQVINVLQGEVDVRDQQLKDLTERLQRLQVERESLEAKMEAEKHVMRAQLRDMMEKQCTEIQRLSEQHQAQLAQTQQELLGQMEELRRASAPSTSREASGSERAPADAASVQRIAELEAQAKQKTEEASRSEAKFLKMKAWSKSRIRQLEEELKKTQAGDAHPDLISLQSHITALEEEREENLCKLEQYDELQANNEMLRAKLAAYEEQQRTLQADLEQFTKRAASQASESGSADDAQSQVLEWQEMVAEAASARERAKGEKAAMALRISHMEEEREALETRQQELEEELAQARGLGQLRAKKMAAPSQRSLQEDFEFDGRTRFQDARSASESTTPMEGENMGDGLRSVVEELELERNQLQEQILSLEERCQDLEDRLQLQARIEALQNELEKLQSQLASVRHQQSRDAEKHQLLVNSLNEQLKGLTDMQESLECSLVEKENTLAKTSEKLELVDSLRESLSLKETQLREVSDKLLQTEQSLENVSQKRSSSEKQCGALRTEVSDLTQKLSLLKEKTQKQEVTIGTLQTEMDQTNEELDKLNTAYLEERAQLIHDLQSCEREMDGLKDALLEKEKEIRALSGNISEYTEQLSTLKQDLKIKEDNLNQVENALSKAEREVAVLRESQNSDQQTLESKITELVESLKDAEVELAEARDHRDSKTAEVETLVRQADDDKKTIQELRGELQKQMQSHSRHLSECETHIASLKEQLMSSAQKLQESLDLQQQLRNKEQSFEKELKSSKDEQNRLCSQVERYRNEMMAVSQQLEEQKRTEDVIRGEMKEQEEAMASLEMQLREAGARAEGERQRLEAALKTRDSEKEMMSSDLQGKSENISSLQNLIAGLESEKKQLQESLEALKQNLRQLQEQVASALDSNASYQNQVQQLSAEAARLQQELTDSQSTIAELGCDKESLRGEVSAMERRVSENAAAMEALQKEKEELALQNREMNRVLEQSSRSSSEILLEKASECDGLQRSLGEEEEKVAHLRERVGSLTARVDQLQGEVAAKDQALFNLRGTLEEQQKQLTQLREEESSLKTQLREKEEVWEEKHSQACRQIKNREETLRSVKQQCQKHKEELNATNETIKTLTQRIAVLEGNARALEADGELGRREVVQLQSRIQAATEENRQLRAACESKEKELVHHSQVLSDLNGQLKEALEQSGGLSATVSRLTDTNRTLQEELAQKEKSVSELNADKSSLREQLSGLEKQIGEDRRAIHGLLKDKEELATTADGLKRVLQEGEQLNSAGLLQKTNECADLAKVLKDKEGQLQSLREEAGGLKKQVAELTGLFTEREQTVLEQRAQLEDKQNELLQLHDTVRALEEQGSVLRALIQQGAEERQVRKTAVSQLEGELESVRRDWAEAKLQLRQRDEEFQMSKDELNRQTQSVVSLSSQLGEADQKTREMEARVLELTRELEQRNAEATELSDSIQALKEQGAALKSELQETVTALAGSQEEVTRLRTECLVLENLQVTLREKDESLRQKDALIQQLNESKAELDEMLKQKSAAAAALSAKISDLEDSVCRLRGQVDSSGLEVSTLQRSLKQKEESLGTNLQAKEAECGGLKEQASHLQQSVTKLQDALQAQISEVEDLKRVLGQKDVALSDQFKCLQEVQRRADEALLFKTQFAESTELVSQLQARLRSLSAESEHLKESAEETQSAFSNLKEKYAANLEELQDARRQLSQRADEVSSLQKLLDDSAGQHERAKGTTETLRSEMAAVRQKLEKAEVLNAKLSQEKDEALASHQANVSLLTVEIEKLKSQHLQVATQMNVLTENLEQREMALHAINSQYSSQAKHASQLVSEMQKLEEVNARLREEMALCKEENHKLLAAVSSESAHLKEELSKSLAEKKDLENRCRQMEEESSSLKERMERVTSERDGLHTKVSVTDEELCRVRENVQKVEQVLQDSEREWLFVLDREKEEKNLLVEQLRSVESEMKSKDLKVDALKQDLDGLQEKVALASAAQLEKVLASAREKEFENGRLLQALNAAQRQLHTLLQKRGFSTRAPSEMSSFVSEEVTSLQNMIARLEESHRGEVDTLRSDLNKSVAHLQRTEQMLCEGGRCSDEKDPQTALLQARVEELQSQLGAEVEKVEEAEDRISRLSSELREKGGQIGHLNIQMGQQQHLLAGLSQQLLDKDASIARVMESAANERIKTSEEKNALVARLESSERAHQASAKRFEEISQQVSRVQAELEAANSEKSDLIREKDAATGELVRVSKEKEAAKKKLQAALLVRKELLKKVEQYEIQTEEKTQALRLQGRLQDAADQARAAAERYEQDISDLRKGYLEAEGQIIEQKAENERLQSEKQSLESALNEKEQRLSQTLQTLAEKSPLLEQLQASAAAFDQERKDWMQKTDQLQKEIQDRSSDASAAAVELEEELARVTHEKTKLEKKVQAALLARKEALKKAQELDTRLTELKENYRVLSEQLTHDLKTVQLNFEEKVGELEELRKTSSSDRDELASLRQLLQDRDRSLHDLKTTMEERECQTHSVSNLQMELESLKSQIGKMEEDLASKDEALAVGERSAQVLNSKLLSVEEHLVRAQAEIKEKTDQVEKHQDAFKALELKVQQEKHALISERDALESRLDLLESASAALEEKQSSLDLLKQEQAEAVALIRELKDELGTANKRLAELDEAKTCHQNLQSKLKEREEALLMSRARLSEKEELVAALELQLQQQQIRAHEASAEREKPESAELQGSQHGLDSQSKIAALTRKLQAALLSRKELMKENLALKQDTERLAEKERAKELEFSALEAALEETKRRNTELERSASSASNDGDKLRGEVHQLLRDNHSLSAACDSLKLTIENITQQKEAFSCQLESLKDSQTDELSKWKSRHAELKQEYESLLQSYENISSEMDKMRQVLEATKRDRQEAIKKVHHLGTEKDTLEKQVVKLEEERVEVEQLEEENRSTRRQLEEAHRREVSELADKNRQLEAEIRKLKASSEELQERVSELRSANDQMAAKLEESTCTLERTSAQSKAYTSSMQLRLDEALGASSSLSARIETQASELGAQVEVNDSLRDEKQNLCQQIEEMQRDHRSQLGKKDAVIQELEEAVSGHVRDITALNDKVRVLEDDKSLLREQLENVREISDKVTNQNERLETAALKSAEKIEELTESVAVLRSRNAELSSELAASNHVLREKEEEQLRLVREFEGKLKTVQRGNEGSKSVNKELQELLKEKHQEINQLQQNCIRYQDVILELESSLKGSRAVVEQLEKEVKKSSEELLASRQQCSRAEAELSEQRTLLQRAEDKLHSVESQRDQAAPNASRASGKSDDRVLQETRTDSRTRKEFALQRQMEELILSTDGERERADELKRQPDAGDAEAKAPRRATETDEAKLSALSPGPGGAEASGLWDRLYQKALKEKDSQLLEQGFVIKRFLQDVRAKDQEIDDLRATHLKLLELERMSADSEARLLALQSQNDELRGHAERLEGVSAHLRTLLQSKDAEVNSLLSCKDGQVSGYIEQLQANCRSQAAAYEGRLTSLGRQKGAAVAELRGLEAALRRLRLQLDRSSQEREQAAAEVVLLKKSLASLQGEREQLLSRCRALETARGTEGGEGGEGGASKGLKHEIRKLLNQMDDLNSENAMLRAQLVRYREDLNRVLSLKDSQLKVLLQKQQDVIRNLEHQKADAEKQLRGARLEIQRRGEESGALAAEISQLKDRVAAREAEVLILGNQRGAASQDRATADLEKGQLELQRELAECESRARNARLQNESLGKAMAALQDDRDQLIEDFKTLRSGYDEELRETRAALDKAERSLRDASADLAVLAEQRDVLLLKIKAMGSKDPHAELDKLLDQLSGALTEKERDLTHAVLENGARGRQLAAFSKAMGSLQNERDRLMEELSRAKRGVEARRGSTLEASAGVEKCGGMGVDGVRSEPKTRLHEEESVQGESDRDASPGHAAGPRTDAEVEDTGTARVSGGSEELVSRLQAERIQLHSNLQRCLYEIHQRDQKLQQAAEEKATVTSQLRVVSQTLRDTQTRCQWLEGQVEGHSQGAAYAEVAPGAPQERSNTPVSDERAEANQLRERLLEVEQSLADERIRRESAEEALRLSEDHVKSLSRDAQRDVSIDMETEEEWGAASLDPNQPLMAQKVTGGVLACRRWLRGRSLYFSRLLTSRARSRYVFLFYLFFLHALVFMCLSGAL